MLGGIAFAIGLSLLVTLARVVQPHTAELGRAEGTDTFRDLDRNPDAHPIPGLLIDRIDAVFLEVDDAVERYRTPPPPSTG
jgi:MFS superfamily sulfate permease-like transporter